MNIRKNIKTIFLLVGVMLFLNACVVARAPGHHHPPSLHDTHVHWFYYPDYQVYYHSVDHYYYYLDGGVWIRATTLPPRFILHDSRRVRISITGLPYVRHSHHLRRYPPVRANHRDRRDRRDYRDRFEEERNDSDNDHRQGAERYRTKEGPNIFLPHTKDKQIKRIERDRKVNESEKSKRPLTAEEKQKAKKIKRKKVVEKEKARKKTKNGNKRHEKRMKDEDEEEQDNVRKRKKNDKSNRFFDR